MDESERRRERLKAMRIEAAQVEPSLANHVQVSGLHSLANPLTDASSSQEVTRSASRFDYYTDPLASFSANRKDSVAPGPGHGRARPLGQISPHPETWNPRMAIHPFPGPPAYQAHFPYRAPVGSDCPFIPHHQMPSGVGNSPGFVANYQPQSYPQRGPNFHIYGVQSDRHDFGQGRGRSFQGSYTGRGRGNWADNKVRMEYEQGSKRNEGSTNATSKSLYEKFMVDDPWKSLKPSLWREETSEIALTASKTVGAKRPLEVSTPSTSNSQSLAEYLAESFNEAVKDDPNV